MRENEMDVSIDDLMESEEEMMGIYLMIIHCRFCAQCFEEYRFDHSVSYSSIDEILSVYFGTSSPEEVKRVKNAMVKFNLRIPCGLPQGCNSSICYMAIDTLRLAAGFFINRLKENSDINAAFIAKDHNRFELCHNILEDLEERYFEKFKEVFRNYVRLDTIPRGYRGFVKQFLKLIHNGAISGADSTRMRSIVLWRSDIVLIAEELRGRERKFIDILRKSRLAHRVNPVLSSTSNIIVSSAAAALANGFR